MMPDRVTMPPADIWLMIGNSPLRTAPRTIGAIAVSIAFVEGKPLDARPVAAHRSEKAVQSQARRVQYAAQNDSCQGYRIMRVVPGMAICRCRRICRTIESAASTMRTDAAMAMSNGVREIGFMPPPGGRSPCGNAACQGAAPGGHDYHAPPSATKVFNSDSEETDRQFVQCGSRLVEQQKLWTP